MSEELEARGLGRFGYKFIAGVDEVGTGAIAGPIVVAAVLMKWDATHPLIKDSKAFSSAKKREEALEAVYDIAERCTLEIAPPDEIDLTGHAQALLRLQQSVIKTIARNVKSSTIVVVDGDRMIKGITNEQVAIPKADALVTAVSAASILAKVTRDRLMARLDDKCMGWGFGKHKGYATPQHMRLLREQGMISGVHRASVCKGLLR